MEILEKLPGISVSRYQLLHREASPKRYYSPGSRESHSANQRRNDRYRESSHSQTPPNRENSNEKFVLGESESTSVPSTPLKSILKTSKATKFNSEQEMQTLQVLLKNLNHGNTPDSHSTFPRARTPKTPYYQRHYHQYSAVNDGTADLHNKTHPPVVTNERANSATTRNRSKTVSFKLDPKAKSNKSKHGMKGDWAVMVCTPAKNINTSNTSKRGVPHHAQPVPVFEEKPQSIREVVMNEIKQYYNTGNEKMLPSRTTVPPHSVRSKRTSSPSYRITPTSITSQSNDLNHLHSLADPYRRFLISRGTTNFGYDKAPPLRAMSSTETKIRRAYNPAKRGQKNRRNSYGGNITTNKHPSVEVS